MQAGLGAGDLLLVNGASGCISTAAIQIANTLTARVAASVRTPNCARESRRWAPRRSRRRGLARVGEFGGTNVVLELVDRPPACFREHDVAGSPRRPDAGRRRSPAAEARDRSARPDGARAQLMEEEHPAHTPLRAEGGCHPVVRAPGGPDARIGPGRGRGPADVFALDDAADALDHVRRPGQTASSCSNADRVELRRIDHVVLVVADLPAHVAQLEAMDLVLERISDNIESRALYYQCSDASVNRADGVARLPLIWCRLRLRRR